MNKGGAVFGYTVETEHDENPRPLEYCSQFVLYSIVPTDGMSIIKRRQYETRPNAEHAHRYITVEAKYSLMPMAFSPMWDSKE